MQVKGANSTALQKWISDRWADFSGILQWDLELEKITTEAKLADFGKIAATIKSSPNQRRQIRDKLEPHTQSLCDALNEYVVDAKKKLPIGKDRIVVIADNLDRITLIQRGEKKTNHDEIFIDRADQLKGLKCNIIYTVPISLVHSGQATVLQENYGIPVLLPMIAVRNKQGTLERSGLRLVQQVVQSRIKGELVPAIFASQEVLDALCLLSGGHLRTLMMLMKEMVNIVDGLPLDEMALKLAASRLRNDYHRAISDDEWPLLAKTSITRKIENNDMYRKLLFTRCILEYAGVNDDGEYQWHGIHPLIAGIQEFKDALTDISN